MTQTAFVLDHEEYLRYAARRAIHQGIFGSVAAPAKATSYPPEIFDVVRPKAAQEVGKEDQASKDTEFEEEYRIAKTTRNKTAKERAILPGARLDRHPSDEVDSTNGAEAQESEATPAAKRRRSSVGTVATAEPAASPTASTKGTGQAASSPSSTSKAQASQVVKAASPGKAAFPPRPVEIDPSKPEELLFSRVAVRSNAADGSSQGPVLVAQKARITAIAGDALEVVAEGSWSTHNVSLGDVSLIEESQFGVPTVKSTDPISFPAP